MTPMFKLKPEARKLLPTFDKDIKPLEWWMKRNIREELLDSVQNVYIDYGKQIGDAHFSLKGMDNAKSEAFFNFTLRVNDISLKEYIKVDIVKLMDDFQKIANKHIKQS